MKKSVVAIVVASSCLFVASVFVAGCVITRGVNSFTSWGMTENATRTDTLPLSLASGETLEITLAQGDIDVQAGESGAPELTALITAYGRAQTDAKKRLDEARVVVERTSGVTRIRVEPEKQEVSESGGMVTMRPRADLKLRIPAGVKLDVHVSAGDIRTRGKIAASQLVSSYGDVKVAEASGDLVLESSSGSVELAKLEGAQKLSARSSYGDVKANDVEAKHVSMHSSSGDVSLTNANCTAAELDTSYGNVVAEQIGGDLKAKTSSGSVRALAIRGKTAQVESGYGDVVLRGFSGTATASSSSGGVQVVEIQGTCDARSGYGDVKIEGVLTRVTASSQTGAVRVDARQGSAPDAEWSLESGYGDVVLTLPRELGFELAARTGYGELDVDVPVLVEAGALKDKHALRGKVGAGGQRISLRTNSGDVRVRTQDR